MQLPLMVEIEIKKKKKRQSLATTLFNKTNMTTYFENLTV